MSSQLTHCATLIRSGIWAARDVKFVGGDIEDVVSLTAAITSAHAGFAKTDYRVPLSDPSVDAEAENRAIRPGNHWPEIEIQRGEILAVVAVAPQPQRTLKRYVYSSLGNHSKLSGVRYTHNWHWDSKAAVGQYIRNS